MDESVFLVLDYDKVCRLCLNTKGAMSDIFETTEDFSLQLQITTVTGLNVSVDDGLPTRICHKCRYIVELCFELRDMVFKANKLLMEVTKQSDKPSDVKDHFEVTGKLNSLVQEEDTKLIKNENLQITAIEEKYRSNEDAADEANENTNTNKASKSIKIPSRLTCQICLKTFPSVHKVYLHVRSHYGNSDLTPYTEMDRPYRCEKCKENGIKKRQLILHHRRHLNINPFVCLHPECSFVGRNQEALRHHGIVHGARVHVCERCGASYRRKFELQQHWVRHEDEGAAYPCRTCRVVCRNRITYRNHLRNHEVGRKYKCDRLGCPKAFYTRTDLTVHLRSHDNDRCYKCHLCVSAYSSQSLLNRHLRAHERYRSNKCDKCSATFDNYGAFYNHRVSAHGPWLSYKCDGCNRGYQTEEQLHKHCRRCDLSLNLKLLQNKNQYESNSKPIHKSLPNIEKLGTSSEILTKQLVVRPADMKTVCAQNSGTARQSIED